MASGESFTCRDSSQVTSEGDKENVPAVGDTVVTARLYDALAGLVSLGQFTYQASAELERKMDAITYTDYCDLLRLYGRSSIPLDDFDALRRLDGLYLHILMPYPLGFTYTSGTGVDCWLRVLDSQDRDYQDMSSTPVTVAAAHPRILWAPPPARKGVMFSSRPSLPSKFVQDMVAFKPPGRPSSRITADQLRGTAGNTPVRLRSVMEPELRVVVDRDKSAFDRVYQDHSAARNVIVPSAEIPVDWDGYSAILARDGSLVFSGFDTVDKMPSYDHFIGEKPFVVHMPVKKENTVIGSVSVLVVPSQSDLQAATVNAALT